MSGTTPIPVHLVLGGLGSGKTTVIRRLLESAPRDETWAVLLNSNNQAEGMDNFLARNSPYPERLIVKVSHGGCFCCSGAPDLAGGLNELVQQQRPDRILVEPAGLADPLTMLDQIRTGESEWGVRLASTIGIIDIRRAGHQRFREMPFLRHLLDCSDYIVGSKADRTDSSTVFRFRDRMEAWLDGAKPFSLDNRQLASGSWMLA